MAVTVPGCIEALRAPAIILISDDFNQLVVSSTGGFADMRLLYAFGMHVSILYAC